MKVQLVDLGRRNINKTVEVKSWRSLEREIQKHLTSKDWSIDEVTDELWEVFAGIRKVGEVKILSK